MSQYIFDQVYGSQARKKKILESNSFLYYRQIMQIKSKHIKNPSLYSQVYELPNNETLHKQSFHNHGSKLSYSPDFLSTLNQNNYAIQKLNSHAFKIVKRKQKVAAGIKNNQNNNNFTICNNSNININRKGLTHNRFFVTSERKITSRTISRDQHDLKEYLNRQQHTNSKASQRQKNFSLSFSSNKNVTISTTFNKPTQRSISPFSTIRQSGISFIKP